MQKKMFIYWNRLYSIIQYIKAMFHMIFPHDKMKWKKIRQASQIYVALFSPKLPEFPSC